MEIALIVELLIKSVLTILVKECFTVCKTVIDDNRKVFYNDGDISIEVLLELNDSLKIENEFQREQIVSLLEKLKSCSINND